MLLRQQHPISGSSRKRIAARRLYFFLEEIGINPLKTWRFIRSLPWLIKDSYTFAKLNRQKVTLADWQTITWSLFAQDKYAASGSQNSLYFLQDLICSQYITSKQFVHHMDVGSRVDGFLAHVATTRAVTALDIRPCPQEIRNITFVRGDILELDKSLEGNYDLTTSLHALEHVGLGRYGDTISPGGMFKAIENCRSLTKVGGETLIALPVVCGSNNIIEFNAQRLIASQNYLALMLSFFGDDKLAWWMCIDDERRPVSGCLLKELESSLNTFKGLGIIATSWTKSDA